MTTAIKNYKQMYQEQLEASKKMVLGSQIYDALEIKAISNKKIDDIMISMQKITGKPVYEDFNFRNTGKIFGILRHIIQNPKQRKELLEVTGLSNNHIDIYYRVAGNLPYPTKDNKVDVGRPMDINATKELIAIVAITLGILLDDVDLMEINQEHWDRLVNNALEKAAETVSHNEQFGETIPEQYNE